MFEVYVIPTKIQKLLLVLTNAGQACISVGLLQPSTTVADFKVAGGEREEESDGGTQKLHVAAIKRGLFL